MILSCKEYTFGPDSGVFKRLHSYVAGSYARISLFMFYILMVTSSNVGSYLVVDSNEQVCMKAALHDLAAKQFTAFKAGRCLLLATARPR